MMADSRRQVFKGRDVCELGAGVGLPGLLLGRHASRMVLTDYVDPILEVLRYNVRLNNAAAGDGGEFAHLKGRLTPQTEVAFLDWDADQDEWGDEGLIEPHSFDILIGSELTYSTLSVETLPDVICGLLRPGGVLYEILSDDRDGVKEFVAQMEQRGWRVDAAPVPAEYCRAPLTGQRPESYHLFSVHHPESSNPSLLFSSEA